MTKTPAQLDHEIAESLSRPIGAAVDGKQPLYGHTSEATAYVVDDYPYGFRERTQIRYWLEAKPKKGWGFVSQTLNPKTSKPLEQAQGEHLFSDDLTAEQRAYLESFMVRWNAAEKQCGHHRTRDGGAMYVDATTCCLDCGAIRRLSSAVWSDGSKA